ncbi:unnamed protein product [Chrysoparadoxa australica]
MRLPGGPHLEVLTPLSREHYCVLLPILNWYNQDPARVTCFSDALFRNRGPSLRLIDYLVVSYSRHHRVMVTGQSSLPTDLWDEYRRALGTYGKKLFDVFKRKHYISIRLHGRQEIYEATIGQLTFFQWYQQLGLDKYMEESGSRVREHMKASESGKGRRGSTRHSAVKPTPNLYLGSVSMEFS